MRSPTIRYLVGGFAAVVIVAVLILGLTQRDDAFTLGVQPALGVIGLEPGQHACQRGVGLGAEFDRVEIYVGTYGKAGEKLQAKVKSNNKTIASGILQPGYGDNTWQEIRLSETVKADPFDLCVYNIGRKQTALYGGPALAAPNSYLEFKREQLGSDISLRFGSPDRSLLAEVPDMLTRASRFNLVGAWVLGLLGAGVVVGVPLLLTAAVSKSRDD